MNTTAQKLQKILDGATAPEIRRPRLNSPVRDWLQLEPMDGADERFKRDVEENLALVHKFAPDLVADAEGGSAKALLVLAKTVRHGHTPRTASTATKTPPAPPVRASTTPATPPPAAKPVPIPTAVLEGVLLGVVRTELPRSYGDMEDVAKRAHLLLAAWKLGCDEALPESVRAEIVPLIVGKKRRDWSTGAALTTAAFRRQAVRQALKRARIATK